MTRRKTSVTLLDDDWVGGGSDYSYDWSRWKDPWPAELRAARSDLIWARGYLASLLYGLQPVKGFPLPTLGVDAYGRLFYHEDVFTKWTPKELTAVLYHETQHVQKGHAARFLRFTADRLAKGKPPADPMVWNICCDMEINQWIAKEKGITLPADGVFPGTYGLEEGHAAEEYYAFLESLTQNSGASLDGAGSIVALGAEGDGQGDGQPDQGQDQQTGQNPGQGQGAGSGTERRMMCGSLSVVPEPESPALEELAKQAGVTKRRLPGEMEQILDDVMTGIETRMRQIGMGGGEGHQARWAQQRREGSYDWRRELRGELGDLKTNVSGQARQNYRRPSRRQQSVPNIILAGRVNPLPDVAAFGDTSGSMGSNELNEVARQLPGIVAACGGSVRFAAIDTQIQATQRVTRASSLNLRGGGGTDMRLAIQTADQMVPRPHVCIVLTDGMSRWDMPQPRGLKVIIGLIADSIQEARERQKAYEIPDWMRVIPIPVQQAYGED